MDGIQAAVDRIVQQLPVGQGVQKDIKSAFIELLDRVVSNKVETSSSTGSNGAASTQTPTATQLLPEALAAAAGSSASTTGSALLKNPGQPLLEQLSNDLMAEDPAYNQREVELRDRLDMPELERRLRSSAQAFGVEYDASDLEGILRNAGYGAAHLGSSERYMAAIEKFAGQAESTYRTRAGNIPGLQA